MSSKAQPAPGRFFTVAELAAHLRVSRRTIERSLWSGDLEHYRIGGRIIIHEAAVLSWLENKRITKQPGRGRTPGLQAL